MALRVWIKFRLKWRSLVGLLCFFSLSAVMIYTFLPFLSEPGRMHQRGPRNNKPNRLVKKDSLRSYLPPPSYGNSKTWKNPDVKDSTKHLLMVNHHQLSFVHGKTARKRVHPSTKKLLKNKENQKEAKLQGQNKHIFHPSKARTTKGQACKPDNSNCPYPAIHLLRSRHDPALHQSASVQSLHPNNMTCRDKCTPDGAKVKKLVVQFTDVQQVVKLNQASGDTGAHDRHAEPYERKRAYLAQKKGQLPAGTGRKDPATDWCKTLPDEAVEEWNLTRPQSLPWFSVDDIKKMELLSRGDVLSKARLPGHGQVLQVAFSDRNNIFASAGGNNSKYCQAGSCALIKRPSDWFEVFAFHLDRVLGLNRSLPAVLRTFHSNVLPYKYTDGSPRPAVWWDPSIQHLSDVENDQNSFSLTWPQYQAVLKSRCGTHVPLNFTTCVGVHHSEWGRLALFDFLLQVNDRLDRNCCGFKPDPSELCVENLLHLRCGNPKDLHLVHILVRKTEPSKLVFIDNSGRPHQPSDNLNFRLVEGIDEFPERAVSVVQSGCLERMLLRSLSMDQEFWMSRGGASGLKSLIRYVEQRAKALLQHIQEKKLRLNRDL